MNTHLRFSILFAGIEFGNVYKEGVNQELLGHLSTGVFIVSQIAALLFIIAVFQNELSYSTPKSIRVGIGVQLTLTFVFFWVSIVSILLAVDLAYYPSITPPWYELACCIKPYYCMNLLLAGLATFVLIVSLSYTLLRYLEATALRSRDYSLIHAAVMHPLFFPLNILLGIYQFISLKRTLSHDLREDA